MHKRRLDGKKDERRSRWVILLRNDGFTFTAIGKLFDIRRQFAQAIYKRDKEKYSG